MKNKVIFTSLLMGLSLGSIAVESNPMYQMPQAMQPPQQMMGSAPNMIMPSSHGIYGAGMMQPQMQAPQGPPSVLEQALSLHQAGRYADAVHLYESIIYTSAPDPRLYASIADAHFRLGNNERALKYGVEALKLDPSYASGHLLLGTILGDMGDLVRAIRSYKKVLVLDQNNPYAYYNLGILHYKKADIKNAIEYLENAKVLNPQDPKIWNNLGVIYYDQQLYETAGKAFSMALQLNPNYTSARRNLMLVEPHLPPPPVRSEKATKDLEESIKLLEDELDPDKADKKAKDNSSPSNKKAISKPSIQSNVEPLEATAPEEDLGAPPPDDFSDLDFDF